MTTVHWRLTNRFIGRLVIELILVPYNFISSLPAEGAAVWAFVRQKTPTISLRQRLNLVWQSFRISNYVPCAHVESEILTFLAAGFSIPADVPGCFVEAGAFKGGSAAKFSLGAKMVGRRLFVFDSFEGIPDNTEPHGTTIYGEQTDFRKGAYSGSIERVRDSILRFGHIDVCEFVRGWFAETMPSFREPIVAMYLDVDLASSTRDCLKHLYPLLQPGGFLFSQDAHLPLVIDVLKDDAFWEKEVGSPRPEFQGLGQRRLVFARKPLPTDVASS
jgi:O-methyltransferase